MAKQTFYGFRAHLRVSWPGVIVGLELAPADIHELQVLGDLSTGVQGWVIGDRNYWNPTKREELASRGISAKRDKKP
ncbi:MAG TPA: hypothetical protein ENK06_14085 [Gammaproteobacteria bacterium]|nr:hypothetical protein [Gammaproteobacteria bacterium]